MFEEFMQKFVRFLDPKLERFRPKKSEKLKEAEKPKKISDYTPKTLEDFIGVIKRSPESVLSTKERNRIAAVMNFDEKTVGDLMIKKSDLVFVKDSDVLGPLVLDKLYKSGFTVFPVVDSKEKIKGVIRTEALNALEIKNTDRATKYLDKNVNFLRPNDSLEIAAAEIEGRNCSYFLVKDSEGSLVGFFTLQILLDYLLGKN